MQEYGETTKKASIKPQQSFAFTIVCPEVRDRYRVTVDSTPVGCGRYECGEWGSGKRGRIWPIVPDGDRTTGCGPDCPESLFRRVRCTGVEGNRAKLLLARRSRVQSTAYFQSSWVTASLITESKFECFLIKISLKAASWRRRKIGRAHV